MNCTMFIYRSWLRREIEADRVDLDDFINRTLVFDYEDRSK